VVGHIAAAPPYVPPVDTRYDPPSYSDVTGNCPPAYGDSAGSSGTWTTVHDTDYGGSVLYNTSYSPFCNGDLIAYAPTSASQTAQFRWHFESGAALSPSRCYFYAYIPYHDATDTKARYDFWYQNSSGGPVIWSAWPGETINQEPIMNWYYIGTAYVPAGHGEVTVSLSNTGPAGQKAGAGSVASACYQL